MPPADASTDADSIPAHPGSSDSGGNSEDTLDLRLPDELVAFFAGEPDDDEGGRAAGPIATTGVQGPSSAGASAGPAADVGRRPWELGSGPTCPPPDTVSSFAVSSFAGEAGDPGFGAATRSFSAAGATTVSIAGDDLLDHVAAWGATTTSAGRFQLVPVCLDHDLLLISRWMNDPAVAAFWELAGSPERTEAHLRAHLAGDGRSVPCLGVLDDTPMSYWEIYRADLDPLARHYPARPHDTGIHLLVGGVADRGRGLGSTLLRAVADLVMSRRPTCARVVAEPDLRNTPSIAAFLSAGFRFTAEVELPAKRAALMMRDRSLRDVL
ncbi:GNAT family N-acetyltransferase [Streptomyces sp. NPDC056161]|uniref:GNAT family N-acetyltransferase n=1 Tax=Streptomyces sp. NPDC056161 TaxID=3345732 RepID=UPI0035D73535